MVIDTWGDYPAKDLKYLDEKAKERAEQIFKSVQGMKINSAISLLEWCSSRLITRQKCDISDLTEMFTD